jgi:hypothetical protein
MMLNTVIEEDEDVGDLIKQDGLQLDLEVGQNLVLQNQLTIELIRAIKQTLRSQVEDKSLEQLLIENLNLEEKHLTHGQNLVLKKIIKSRRSLEQ